MGGGPPLMNGHPAGVNVNVGVVGRSGQLMGAPAGYNGGQPLLPPPLTTGASQSQTPQPQQPQQSQPPTPSQLHHPQNSAQQQQGPPGQAPNQGQQGQFARNGPAPNMAANNSGPRTNNTSKGLIQPSPSPAPNMLNANNKAPGSGKLIPRVPSGIGHRDGNSPSNGPDGGNGADGSRPTSRRGANAPTPTQTQQNPTTTTLSPDQILASVNAANAAAAGSGQSPSMGGRAGSASGAPLNHGNGTTSLAGLASSGAANPNPMSTTPNPGATSQSQNTPLSQVTQPTSQNSGSTAPEMESMMSFSSIFTDDAFGLGETFNTSFDFGGSMGGMTGMEGMADVYSMFINDSGDGVTGV